MRVMWLAALSLISAPIFADTVPGEWVVKFHNAQDAQNFQQESSFVEDAKVTPIVGSFVLVKGDRKVTNDFVDTIEYVQPNFIYRALAEQGNDPLASKQWGMTKIKVPQAWEYTRGSSEVIVAVIDTGVDYNHEDLKGNIWRNTAEIPGNGIDDDNNGYIDDIRGWDFNQNDNDPMDETGSVLSGGNPGHGTHCAGNVGAVGGNGIGISGASPQVTIMPLRFLGKDGQGTTAMAIGAIQYAIDNGAQILSNSWGSTGPSTEPGEDKALQDVIVAAQNKNILFIAAAGNHAADNDDTKKAGYPASFTNDNIISVAASTQTDTLASFSCYGKTSVDIAAPGTAIYSTVPGNKYQSAIIPFLANWDGTSMAAPHVSGVAALIKALRPEFGYKEIKKALLDSVDQFADFKDKTVSGGRLNAEAALKMASGM